MAIPSWASEDLVKRAMRPRLEFGRGLLAPASRNWGTYLVLTMPEPWKVAEPMLANPPSHVHFVDTMDRDVLERLEAQLPRADTLVGLGGGMSLDMAKYVALKRGVEPVLIPSTASVDACVTNSIAVREHGRVRYIGFVVPQVVISDFDLMRSAPININRAGIGDILSIHTGLWDWKAGADQGLIPYDEEIAWKVSELLDHLEALGEEIREATDSALKWLIQAYAAENELCLKLGHSRPEEGSEHYLAYNIEYRTGRGYVHGELVCLGVLLMSQVQENDVERVQRILAETRVRFQPRDLNLSLTEFENALLTLPAYVENEGLPYSVINKRPLDEKMIKEFCQDLLF